MESRDEIPLKEDADSKKDLFINGHTFRNNLLMRYSIFSTYKGRMKLIHVSSLQIIYDYVP